MTTQGTIELTFRNTQHGCRVRFSLNRDQERLYVSALDAVSGGSLANLAGVEIGGKKWTEMNADEFEALLRERYFESPDEWVLFEGALDLREDRSL